MVRRYLLPCAIITLVSIATAGLAYKAAAPKNFQATCSFQALLRLTQGTPISKDAIDQHNRVAFQHVQVAAQTTVYKEVAKAQKADVRTIERAAAVGPLPSGLAIFVAKVTAKDASRAIAWVNAVCQQFVTDVAKARTAELKSDQAAIEKRIVDIETSIRKLQAVPKKNRSATQNAQLVGLAAARKANVQLLADQLSLPPDDIGVLTKAQSARRTEHRSLSKNLVIALLAALLACFLVVLIGESLAESRRRAGFVPS
jgi:hypothetical protein